MHRLIAVAVLVAAPSAAAQGTLSPPERTAAFKAAGFVQRAGAWRTDCDEPGGGIYEPGAIETVRDLNGDGQPEAVVTEGSTISDPNRFARRMTGLLTQVAAQAAGHGATATASTQAPVPEATSAQPSTSKPAES